MRLLMNFLFAVIVFIPIMFDPEMYVESNAKIFSTYIHTQYVNTRIQLAYRIKDLTHSPFAAVRACL